MVDLFASYSPVGIYPLMDEEFAATLQKSSSEGAWTYVVWPESVEFFGTRGLVKVRGTIDGHLLSELLIRPPKPRH